MGKGLITDEMIKDLYCYWCIIRAKDCKRLKNCKKKVENMGYMIEGSKEYINLFGRVLNTKNENQ